MRRTFRREREFGLIVGGVLTLLSCWWFYRGRQVPVAQLTLPVGVLLVLLGVTFPKSLVWPNRGWMLLAEGLSFVMTRIILGIVFFGSNSNRRDQATVRLGSAESPRREQLLVLAAIFGATA